MGNTWSRGVSPLVTIPSHVEILLRNEEIGSFDNSSCREHEFVLIPLRAKLEEEEYTLVIEYEAEVRHALKGFYRSYYTTSQGEQR